MGNYNGSNLFLVENIIECFLNHQFRFCIQCRCGFVEQENLGVADQNTGNRNTLLLSTRKLSTLVSDLRVVTIGQLGNKIMRIGQFGSFFNLFLRRVRVSVGNVVTNGGGKECGFLSNVSNQGPQITDINILDIGPIQLDCSRLWIIKTFQQAHDGGFSTSGGSDKGHDLSGHNFGGKVGQNGICRTGGVGKVHVFNRNVPLDILGFVPTGITAVDFVFGQNGLDFLFASGFYVS
mmetsp:Transcript_11177/g.22870  ORF Transcript_11177/g.22870 Transcript_11177/m.22870 type:complete len:235 (-) Transcript_11177:1126-1830(-)